MVVTGAKNPAIFDCPVKKGFVFTLMALFSFEVALMIASLFCHLSNH
jgi:hypothetical protein